MATRPIRLPEWATGVGANIVEPSQEQKESGWTNSQVPPSSYENWRGKNVYDWIKYLDEKDVEIEQSITGFPTYSENNVYLLRFCTVSGAVITPIIGNILVEYNTLNLGTTAKHISMVYSQSVAGDIDTSSAVGENMYLCAFDSAIPDGYQYLNGDALTNISTMDTHVIRSFMPVDGFNTTIEILLKPVQTDAGKLYKLYIKQISQYHSSWITVAKYPNWLRILPTVEHLVRF